MLLQLLAGLLVSVINIMIHSLATVTAITIARRAGLKDTMRPRIHLMGVMAATVLVLMLVHTVEVVIWALAYALVGAAPEGSDLLYFAFVNYCTLGYGDIMPVKEWRLLGPIASMNGILLFGWSTAVLFEVLLRTIEHLGKIKVPGNPFSAANRD